MKKLLFLILTLLYSITITNAEQINGFFSVDKSIKISTLNMSGTVVLRDLFEGYTYQITDDVTEITPLENTTFFFSGGPLIEVGANSTLGILSFSQDVKNVNSKPMIANFGSHTLNIQLKRGEFTIVYPNKDINSRINVNVPYGDYELSGGRYYFKLTEKSIMGIPIDGSMILHENGKKPKTIDVGSMSLIVSFGDAEIGLDDKYVSSVRKLKKDEESKFSQIVLTAERKLSDIAFFIIERKLVGIWVK